ncbi:hypothetical protein PMKS-002534 [Pichia membranifaciens]|uniref:Nonsense-mediated mRNA decay factor n=1 Tax=Pichia membranifaciens TaxID=4926 RepID=A0A1Q2YHS9_9ASCO|nr:hypothetical protein PMKS-002534 [Pichia membranifaciens]
MASDPTVFTPALALEPEPTQTMSVQDIDSIINTHKASIREILASTNTIADPSLLQGALSFCHSKFTAYILDILATEYKELVYDASDNKDDKTGSTSPTSALNPNVELNFNLDSANSVGNIVDRVWIEIHHPAIKYFQSTFYQLNKNLKEHSNNAANNNSRQYSGNKSSKYNSNNGSSQSFVEYRKLFDRFVKFIAKAYEFYFFILKSILNTYDLTIYIPVKKLCSTLKINLDSVSDSKDTRLHLPDSNHLVSSIVYLTHKCVLFIGDLSRYRTLIAKTYLPSTSISKEDNNNYSKSIELYKLSLLILPSLGDPYNHIAIIDNLKDDKFNVVYNFIRASLTSSPLTIAYSNLLNLLSKHPRTNSILRKFEHLNSLDRNSITKNDRLGLLKAQFLILFNYNLLPNKWKLKSGYLISGHSISLIENDFYYLLSTLDFHKQIFNDFYFKQFVILTGGFELLIDSSNLDDPKLSHSPEIISDYLSFMFRYMETFLKICIFICDDNKKDSKDGSENTSEKDDISQNFSISFSTSLLPVIRLLLCWFNEREIARFYLQNSNEVSYLLSTLINRLINYFDEQKVDLVLELMSMTNDTNITFDSILTRKPVRQRLFKEDVALREFKPVNYLLTDFNDSHLYRKDPESVLALIGELPEFSIPVESKDKKEKNSLVGVSTKINDNLLRLVAIIVLGKKLILENTNDIKWVDEINDADTDKTENKSHKLLGSLIIPKQVNLEIIEQVISKANNSNNGSNSNINSKTKDQNHKQPRKKKNDNSRNNNTPGSTNMSYAYAGSSFSTFGVAQPESFERFDKFKRNKSANKVGSGRSQSNMASSSDSIVAGLVTPGGTSDDITKLKRPQTSPELKMKSGDDSQSSHSQYVDMVASIVNEENDSRNKNSKNDRNNLRSKSKEASSLNSNDLAVGNIGITKVNSVPHTEMSMNEYPDNNNNGHTDGSYREGKLSNVNLSLERNYERGYTTYFNQWDSVKGKADLQDQNAENGTVDKKVGESTVNERGSGNGDMDQMNLINQMSQINLMNQINMNQFPFNQMNQYGQMGGHFNPMEMNPVSLPNIHEGFNMNNMGVNNVNMNRLNNNINNIGHMNNMNSMNGMNNMGLNHVNNMPSVNLDTMNNIGMNNIVGMNMSNIGNMGMNMNEIPNMSNLHSFGTLNNLNSLNGNLMGLNNNMAMPRIGGLANNLDMNNINSSSVFNDSTESDGSINNGNSKNKQQK